MENTTEELSRVESELLALHRLPDAMSVGVAVRIAAAMAYRATIYSITATDPDESRKWQLQALEALKRKAVIEKSLVLDMQRYLASRRKAEDDAAAELADVGPNVASYMHHVQPLQ
jgi:hypothetical protein